MSTPDQEQPPGPQDDPFAFLKEPPRDDGALKSRALGVLAVLFGAGLIVWAIVGGWMPRKVFFALVSLGPPVLWMGIGLIVFPLTREQFDAFYNEQSFGRMWTKMPSVWKVWFVLMFALMAAGFVYAIMVAG